MSPELAHQLALFSAVLATVCFMWPSLLKIMRKGQGAPVTPSQALKSPLWWAGLALTLLTLVFLQLAPDAA